MVAGILIAVGAAACFEVAYVLQALQARDQPAERGLRLSLLLGLLRNWRWALPTLLTGVGAALQVWALALAPISVVQPVLAVGLLALPLLALGVLGERPRAAELAGIAAIVAGVAVIGIHAPEHVGRRPADAALGIELAVLVAVLVTPFALRARGGARLARLAVLGAACGDAAAAIGLKLTADQLHAGAVGWALAWGALAGACGALALTAEMTALQRMRATRIAPVVVSFQVLIPVATGLALLGDSWRRTPGGGLLLGAAVAAVVAGATLLSSARSVEELVPPED